MDFGWNRKEVSLNFFFFFDFINIFSFQKNIFSLDIIATADNHYMGDSFVAPRGTVECLTNVN